MPGTAGYRRDWTLIGDSGSPGQRHRVYVSPGGAVAWRTTRDVPNGTVILKEVSSNGVTSGWFVMIRDRTHRFPNSSLWAEGWGWSWVDARDPARGTSTSFAADCRSCHVAASATRWVHAGLYSWGR